MAKGQEKSHGWRTYTFFLRVEENQYLLLSPVKDDEFDSDRSLTCIWVEMSVLKNSQIGVIWVSNNDSGVHSHTVVPAGDAGSTAMARKAVGRGRTPGKHQHLTGRQNNEAVTKTGEKVKELENQRAQQPRA